MLIMYKALWEHKELQGMAVISFDRLFFFLEQFQVHSEIEGKVQRFPKCPSPPHAQPPPWSTSPPEWYICYNWWTDFDTSQTPEVHSLHHGSFLVLQLYTCLNTCMMTCIDRYSVIQSIFTSLKFSVLCLLTPPSDSPWALTATGLFTVPTVFPF